jgi:hypothetical protein
MQKDVILFFKKGIHSKVILEGGHSYFFKRKAKDEFKYLISIVAGETFEFENFKQNIWIKVVDEDE